jgi:hypothetical protein
MTVERKTRLDHINTASLPTHDHQVRNAASKVGRFLLHWLEMLLAMGAGMGIFHLLVGLVPASSVRLQADSKTVCIMSP